MIALLLVVLGAGIFVVMAHRRRRQNLPADKSPVHESIGTGRACEPGTDERPQPELIRCPSCGTKFLYGKNQAAPATCPNCEQPYPNDIDH
ncbi:MAG: hypothetical protein SCI25_14905 [Desulfuromonadales bacterium]|nr:hypothetical protein [Desulfuromonadales bacterium]